MFTQHPFLARLQAAAVICLALGTFGAVHASARGDQMQAADMTSIEAAVLKVAGEDPSLAGHVRTEKSLVSTDSIVKVDYYSSNERHFGICMVHIWAPSDQSFWGRYLPKVSGDMQGIFLEASAAHELAHCKEFLSAFDDFDKSGIVFPGLRSSVHDLTQLGQIDQAVPQVLWRESLADLDALLYVQAHYPAQFEGFRRALLSLRLDPSKHANHNTWEVIHNANLKRAESEDDFSAAVRIRNELYHVPASS